MSISTASCDGSPLQSEEEGKTKIHRAGITRDRRYVYLCTSLGFSLFSVSNLRCKSDLRVAPCGVIDADIVSHTSLAGLQTGKRVLEVWDCTANKSISPKLTVDEEIYALKLNEKRVLVLTRSRLHVCSLRKLELLYSFERGEDIPLVSRSLLSITESGLCAFSVAGSRVRVIDSFTLRSFQDVRAHSSCLSAIELSDEVLVTASVKGTIVRVFHIASMTLVGQFRRGRAETAIRSLHVSKVAEGEVFLTVTGDSDTGHVFRMPIEVGQDPSNSLFSSMLNFFPKHYKDALEAVRDIAQIKLRREGGSSSAYRYVAAVVENGSKREVVVVSEETGFAFIYELPNSGECRLRYEDALMASSRAAAPRAVFESDQRELEKVKKKKKPRAGDISED